MDFAVRTRWISSAMLPLQFFFWSLQGKQGCEPWIRLFMTFGKDTADEIHVSTCAVSSPGVDHAMRESAATSAETTTARLEKPAAPEVEMAFAVATSVSYSLAMAAASVVQPPESRLWTR